LEVFGAATVPLFEDVAEVTVVFGSLAEAWLAAGVAAGKAPLAEDGTAKPPAGRGALLMTVAVDVTAVAGAWPELVEDGAETSALEGSVSGAAPIDGAAASTNTCVVELGLSPAGIAAGGSVVDLMLIVPFPFVESTDF